MHSQTELTDVVQRGPQTEGRVASCYDETRPPRGQDRSLVVT